MERPARRELALASLTTHHVGLEKYKSTGRHDFSHFRADRGVNLRASGRCHGQRWRRGKPGVLRVPLVKLFLDTWAETVELVRPVFRFGIPESSLRDKCPYWRDEGSSLPTTPSFQMRRLQKAISSEGWGTQRAQLFVEAVTPWVVLALNIAAWCYLGSSATKPPAGM
eukprot:XP_001694378.1 predicted protein [Chlamydomonas reinhardtii]